MLPRNELPENHPLLGNDAFAGFRLFCNWKDLQPEKDRLDFTLINAAVRRAGAHDQKVLVSINFGKGAPEWVYEEPHPCTKFAFDFDGDGRSESTMPLGFEESYRRKVDNLIEQLARRYDGDQVVSGFVMTGSGTLGIEFHVVQTTTDIENWEAAAKAAGFTDKHGAIQQCAFYRIDSWVSHFSSTTLLFCLGNPWSNQSGKADEEAAKEYAIARAGICTEFHRASADYTEAGQVLDYPFTEEPVAASTDDSFYIDREPPYPEAPEPVHALLMTAYNKGATMCELWEVDALNEANHETIKADSLKFVSNVPVLVGLQYGNYGGTDK